jgi:hypothetical protein
VVALFKTFDRDLPCGQDDAQRQLEQVVNDVTRSVETCTDVLVSLDRAVGAAGEELAGLAGALLAMANSCQAAAGSLERAQDAEVGGILQQLRFDVSRRFWKDLTDQARHQFGQPLAEVAQYGEPLLVAV